MNGFMPLMRRFSIRLRMQGAIAVVLTLFALVGLAAMLGGRALSQESQHFMEHSVSELHDLSKTREALAQVRLHERNMLIDYEDGVAVLAHREKWAAEIARLQKALNTMLEGDEDEDNPLAREALASVEAYAKETGVVLQRIQDGAFDNSRGADKMLSRAKGHVVKVEGLVGKIAEVLDQEVAESQQAFAGVMNRTLWTFVGVLGLVVLVVVPLTLLNSASIIGPMVHAREIAMAIADGDLTRPIRHEGADEAADLLTSLHHMQQELTRLVGNVREASQSIHLSSGEVASGNADLSERTEQAASSLQQTASSMDVLTGIVRHSADSATQASGLASEASGVARRGGEVVREVVSTMDEINAASHRIADIISVIDGIAFQTNILALNAAVEAARAGEQGRGFAVVAGEVRSLAGRSAEAAREIKGLISASVEKVDNGTRLVRDAGATMTEIVNSVQRVADIIREVSNAADEQSQGIDQVNTAVTDLDRMTQQNAALVEQSSAAAEQLKDQAQNLSRVVESFRLADAR